MMSCITSSRYTQRDTQSWPTHGMLVNEQTWQRGHTPQYQALHLGVPGLMPAPSL
jgi:hypothetical protein